MTRLSQEDFLSISFAIMMLVSIGALLVTFFISHCFGEAFKNFSKAVTASVMFLPCADIGGAISSIFSVRAYGWAIGGLVGFIIGLFFWQIFSHFKWKGKLVMIAVLIICLADLSKWLMLF